MVSSLLLAIGLQIVNRIIAKDPSLRLWALGATLNGAAYVLLALRGSVPDLISIISGNTLLIIGTAWLYRGNRRFLGRPDGFPWYWLLAAVTAATLAYFTYLAPSLLARIVVLSAATATILLASAVVLLRPGDRQDRLVRWFVAAAYLLTAVFLGTRAVVTPLMDSPGQDFLALASPVHTLSLVFAIALNLVLGIGLPLLVAGRIQRRLAEKEARLTHLLAEQRMLLQNDLIGIVTVSNRTILWANQAFEKMLGYEANELNGKPTRQNYASEQAYQDFGAAAYAALSAGEVFRTQIEHLRKDGRHIWVEVSGALLDSESGESLWGFQDVTERRLLEQSIIQSEQRMELALAGADLGLWDLDLPSGRFSNNPRLVTMLGYRPDQLEVTDQLFISLLHPDDVARFDAAFHAHLRGETANFEAEYRLRHRLGNWVWILSRGKVVERGESGRALRLAGTNLDITRRKEAEAVAQEHRNFLSAILENEPECVKVLASDGTLRQMNMAGLAMLEADDVAAVNATGLVNFVVAEHRAAFMDLSRRVFAGESGVLEFEVLGKRGTRRWLDTHAAPLRDLEGKIAYLLAVTRDVTERKRYEATREATKRQLEAQLAEISELQQRLQQQVIRDPLTGLYNRRFLDETLPRELARAKRETYPLALVMVDLDHFKRVNDRHGHAAGDEVLKSLAGILGRGARESDIICRYGGEEFLIALPRMSPEQARQRVEAWRRALSEQPVRHGPLAISLTLSAGIAGFPDHGSDLLTLLSCADAALYRAKEAGRNRVSCFEAVEQS